MGLELGKIEKSGKIYIIILSLVGGWEARSWPAGEVEEGGGGKAGQEKEDWGQSIWKNSPALWIWCSIPPPPHLFIWFFWEETLIISILIPILILF